MDRSAVDHLVRTAKEAAFALECVAHLGGKEKLLLPLADDLRGAIDAVENLPPW